MNTPNLGLNESFSLGLSEYIIFFHYIGLQLDKNGLKEGRLTTFTVTLSFRRRRGRSVLLVREEGINIAKNGYFVIKPEYTRISSKISLAKKGISKIMKLYLLYTFFYKKLSGRLRLKSF